MSRSAQSRRQKVVGPGDRFFVKRLISLKYPQMKISGSGSLKMLPSASAENGEN